MRKTSFQEIWLNERMPVWALRFATLGMCPMPDGVATISTHVVPPKVVDVVVRGIAVVVADLHAGMGRFPQERQRHQYVHKGLASLLPRSGRVAHHIPGDTPPNASNSPASGLCAWSEICALAVRDVQELGLETGPAHDWRLRMSPRIPRLAATALQCPHRLLSSRSRPRLLPQRGGPLILVEGQDK